jgi:hypothetical protein
MHGSSNDVEEKIWKLAKQQQHKMRAEVGKASSSSSARGRAGELRRSVSGRLREQRARLYIMRRCVSMIVRWKD